MSRSRPIVTVYDTGRKARSTCLQAAVRAATTRIIRGDYWHATIFKDDNVAVEMSGQGDSLIALFHNNLKVPL